MPAKIRRADSALNPPAQTLRKAVYYSFWPHLAQNFAPTMDDSDDNPRGPMVCSLRQTHRLKAMTQEQVLALLGPPDYVDREGLGEPVEFERKPDQQWEC